ncbi:hypothetical protein L596_014692 [Steinernema carpocapsae]|uniref:Uncharacterized protein n=1 Tax=Steinernema carpocapsae TaxID=34508 RepID=A0A4U5NDK4_STECR|nr:hypothetical protein L596_014692 [Steinernema carpocapsae]
MGLKAATSHLWVVFVAGLLSRSAAIDQEHGIDGKSFQKECDSGDGWYCHKACRAEVVNERCNIPSGNETCFGMPIRYNYSKEHELEMKFEPLEKEHPRCWAALAPLLCAAAYRPCTVRSTYIQDVATSEIRVLSDTAILECIYAFNTTISNGRCLNPVLSAGLFGWLPGCISADIALLRISMELKVSSIGALQVLSQDACIKALKECGVIAKVLGLPYLNCSSEAAKKEERPKLFSSNSSCNVSFALSEKWVVRESGSYSLDVVLPITFFLVGLIALIIGVILCCRNGNTRPSSPNSSASSDSLSNPEMERPREPQQNSYEEPGVFYEAADDEEMDGNDGPSENSRTSSESVHSEISDISTEEKLELYKLMSQPDCRLRRIDGQRVMNPFKLALFMAQNEEDFGCPSRVSVKRLSAALDPSLPQMTSPDGLIWSFHPEYVPCYFPSSNIFCTPLAEDDLDEKCHTLLEGMPEFEGVEGNKRYELLFKMLRDLEEIIPCTEPMLIMDDGSGVPMDPV